VRDIVTDGIDGMVVPPGDVERLRLSIDRLSRDEMLRRTLGSNAKQVTVRFSVDTILKEWQRLV
jgi:glycosyltransferase involved in cell wall biosynthesis